MQRKLYKELWGMRFQKMLELEEQSITAYQALLQEFKKKYKDETKLQNDFKQLISDEKKHAELVRTLLKIVGEQPDE
ncbi:MAG: hypothetical protein A3C35_08615 [Omnitrophica bacterium RIFCSPHIGHO2_02_FULL_46_11]|nr:MAG: hypothetical protein A3A81_00680 [Omnitrophica bacterium RIFCSPLOWO2_01_FULL_45_10b]OGW87332.1 MAG: hypothetical protein A3C35_08615 [Omnitrophica bacterium RIFCSPHIGHO2_02_FULL_46_11]